MRRILVSFSLLALACHSPTLPSQHELEGQPERVDLGPGRLARLGERLHREILRLRPQKGGYGVLVRHGTWNDPVGGNVASRERALDELHADVVRLDPLTLLPSEVLARRNLLTSIERERERLDLRLDHWRFDPDTEPQSLAYAVAAELPVDTPLERLELFRGWAACGRTVAERIEHLRRSAASGRIAPRSVVLRSISELEEILSVAPIRSPFLDVAKGAGRWLEIAPGANIAALASELYGDAREQSRLRRTNLHLQDGEHAARGTRILVPDMDDDLSVQGRGRFLAGALGSIAGDLYPAFLRYREFLTDELLPRAPAGDASPLAANADGRATYARLLRYHTTLGSDAADAGRLHRDALAWSDEAVERLERTSGTDLDSLRDSLGRDEADANDDSLDVLTASIQKAARAVPLSSATLPLALERLGGDRSWTERAARRDRLGTLRFAYDLPSWALEAAAFRATSPGEHWLRTQRGVDPLQLERFLPESLTAGWGLHALGLANDLGLYDRDIDRIGALAMQALAAAEMLVDTGFHAEGWKRDAARTALAERTLLGPEEVERALDRILADPGRACAPGAGRLLFARGQVYATREFATYLSAEAPMRLDVLEAALTSAALAPVIDATFELGGGEVESETAESSIVDED